MCFASDTPPNNQPRPMWLAFMVQNQLATVASLLLPIHPPRLGVMPWNHQPLAIGVRPPAACLLFLAVFSARNPRGKVPKPVEHCQDVLCACNDFFIKVIHRFLCLVSCPKQGTVLRTQNLKSSRTAAGGAVKADRSKARNALHSTSRPTAVFSCARLVASFMLDDLDGLQLQHP